MIQYVCNLCGKELEKGIYQVSLEIEERDADAGLMPRCWKFRGHLCEPCASIFLAEAKAVASIQKLESYHRGKRMWLKPGEWA